MNLKGHLRVPGFRQRLPLGIGHERGLEGHRTQARAHQLNGVPLGKLVAQRGSRQPLGGAGLDHRQHLPVPDVPGVLGKLPRLAVKEAGGVVPVAHLFHLVPPHRV